MDWHQLDIAKVNRNIDRGRSPKSFVPPEPRKLDKVMMILVWVVTFGLTIGLALFRN